MNALSARREDAFVSLAFAQSPNSDDDVAAITNAVAAVAKRFRYWELLIVVAVDHANDHYLQQCLDRIENIRVITIRPSAQIYPERLVAATEAIGDVLVFAVFAEARQSIDYAALIEAAIANDTVMKCSREPRTTSSRLFEMAGRVSGFHISLDDMHTIAFPRNALNRLLQHPERDLALRFPPLGEGFPVRSVIVPVVDRRGSGGANYRHRASLFYRLSVNAAPVVLSSVGALSVVVTVASLLYVVYCVLVWSFAHNIQPGWFTTSLATSFTAMYLGVALLGISLGMQKILNRLSPGPEDAIVGETVGTSLIFTNVGLNVETDGSEIGSHETGSALPGIAR